MSCDHCGKCCLNMGTKIFATARDVKRWIDEGRGDILKHVFIYSFNGRIVGGELWFDENGNKLDFCPFIHKIGDKIYCRIHETKPEQCKEYSCKSKTEKL